MAAICPTILSGGVGSRLWPLSREAFPKQFLALAGGASLLGETLARVAPAHGFLAPLVVAGEESRFLVAAALQAAGAEAAALLLEPEGRNTAPAVAVAAFHLAHSAPEALMLVLPADHHIADAEAFRAAVARGVAGAEAGDLVTFGVTPRWPETGYGYIRRGAPAAAGYRVERFVEKPDRATAARYLASGEYYWNAGIFLFRPARYLEALAHARPAIHAAARAAVAGARPDLDFIRLERRAFLDCPAESIDTAVMEGHGALQVVPADVGWSDIGSWKAVWDLGPQDADGNVARGDVLLQDCRGSYLRSEGRLIAAVGLDDVVVVETADAVLVSRRERAQEVKAVVERLRAAGRHEHLVHPRVHRPWGSYETVHRGARHQVKHLLVNPGARLSLQLHHRRAEHWIVVSGSALVQRGDEAFRLEENQSTYIPVGVKHRLSNPGTLPLSVVEVQSGDYLGEDDIVRFEDVYDRV